MPRPKLWKWARRALQRNRSPQVVAADETVMQVRLVVLRSKTAAEATLVSYDLVGVVLRT
eukprot:5397859-Pleurochrysis_carterae.AAC.1